MVEIFDFQNLKCPIPFVNMKLALKKLSKGQKITLIINDTSSKKDILAFLTNKQYEFLVLENESEASEITITGR